MDYLSTKSKGVTVMKRVIYKYILKNEYTGKFVADSKGNTRIFTGLVDVERFMTLHRLKEEWFTPVVYDRIFEDEPLY